jgi:hypothetical protein
MVYFLSLRSMSYLIKDDLEIELEGKKDPRAIFSP